MKRPRRGEVWWLEMREEGRRPALILTRDVAIPVLNRVAVVPATRTIRRIPTEVLLDEEDGMPAACVLALENLTVVNKAALRSRITMLSANRLEDVCRAMGLALGC